MQNCIVYNDGVFSSFTDKAIALDGQIVCEHEEPLLFGKENEKGLRMKPGKLELEVVTIGKNNITEKDILRHDETSRPLASILAALQPPNFPVAMGIIFRDPAPSYERSVHEQIAEVTKTSPPGSLNELLHKGRTWTVV